MGRYFDFNLEVVAGDDQTISMTFKTSAGAAVDVSAWDVYYKAEAIDSANSDTVAVAPAAVSKRDSGTGTVDTIDIALTDVATAINSGFYTQEVAIARSGLVETIAKGTLTITDRLTAVTP